MSKSQKTFLSVTLIRSLCKRTRRQLATVRGLGLRRLHHTVQVLDTPQNRGMLNRIRFLLKVEEPS